MISVILMRSPFLARLARAVGHDLGVAGHRESAHADGHPVLDELSGGRGSGDFGLDFAIADAVVHAVICSLRDKKAALSASSRKCRFRQQNVREHRKTVFAHALLLADVVAYQDGRARTAPTPSSGYSVALFPRAETPGKFHKYNTVKVRKCKGRK
ncbi:MAG: hypothetical protein IJ822_04255 [Pyramidobacter sp.]|nr:hypothetical protein [Pyramidobacter sp.]